MDTLDLTVTWLLPTAATLLLLVAYRSGRADGWPARLPPLWWLPIFVVTRVCYALLLFVVLDYWTASDAYAWRSWTNELLAGGVPGRDFENLYGHLYYYLLGGFRLLTPGRHWVGTLWPMMLGDLVIVGCTAFLGRRIGGSACARYAGVYVLLSPYYWHQLVVRGQEESLFVAFLVLGAWLLVSRRMFLAGVALGLGVAINKITIVPYVAAALLAVSAKSPREWRHLAGAAAVVVPVHGTFLALGVPLLPLGNVSEHAENFGLGVSLPDTVARIFPGFPPSGGLAFYGVSMLVALVVVVRLARSRSMLSAVLTALVLIHAVSMISMPFCVSPYLAQGVPFVLLLALLLPADSGVRPWLLVALTLLGGFCTLHWTGSRIFSVPLKPLSLAFSAWLLWLCVRGVPGGTSDECATAPAAP